MTYKNKIIFLLSLIGIMVLLYAGSFIFSPENMYKRTSSFVWINNHQSINIDKIAIKSESQNLELIKVVDAWFVVSNGRRYPALKHRIEDFIGFFTARGQWPVRSSSESSHTGFGLDTQIADRVTIYESNSVILDVLVGYNYQLGNEVAIRKYADNEVRSGDNRIKTYITSSADSWLNLGLIHDNGEWYYINNVQKLTVINEGETQVFSLNNRMWELSSSISGTITDPNQDSIKNYISLVLNYKADDFIISLADTESEIVSRILFEFDNGKITALNFTRPDEEGNRIAYVDDLEYIYAIPRWATNLLFKQTESFK